MKNASPDSCGQEGVGAKPSGWAGPAVSECWANEKEMSAIPSLTFSSVVNARVRGRKDSDERAMAGVANYGNQQIGRMKWQPRAALPI